MENLKNVTVRLKTKRTFLKQGTCSRTFFYIMNREYGHPKPTHEQAVDPLAGGIAQLGYQCGMLWGAALGAGAESFHRFKNHDVAVGMAIKSTQKIHDSFVEHAKTPNCSEITDTDWQKKFSILKYMLRGKMVTCFRLAGKWAPSALKAAEEGLSSGKDDLPAKPMSCASETLRRMGATDEEIIMVAGLAGGLGLSGNACGALAAAIWKNTHERIKKQTYKYVLADPEIEKILTSFYAVTNYEIECSSICGRKFATVGEHSEFMEKGGCRAIIESLSAAASQNR